MKHGVWIGILVVLFSTATSAFAGDREDIQATLERVIEALNKHDFQTYFSGFADHYSAFPYVVSPLRHDEAAWKTFIEGTAALEVIRYHQQDNVIQMYNGNTAVVTGYYAFQWKPKGEELHTQSGRASIVMVKQNGKWLTAHMHFSKMF